MKTSSRFLSLSAVLSILCLLESSPLAAQAAPDLFSQSWPSAWIACPSVEAQGCAVTLFRRTFELASQPEKFIIHVSADNRYRLYLNGEEVSEGPSRGDPDHWRYETVNLAPQLKAGRNVLAALVWNYGEQRPWAQMSCRSAFVLQGDGLAEQLVNSETETWKVIQDKAFSTVSSGWDAALDKAEGIFDFRVVGPGDRVAASLHPWGWTGLDFDDSAWLAPVVAGSRNPAPRGMVDGGSPWNLIPRPIPPMEKRPEAPGHIRRASGIAPDEGFLNGGKPLSVPANSRVSLLIDQGYLTNVYPELSVSGGKGALVRLVWAEALVDSAGNKHNRDKIDGMHMFGNYDEFLPDGGADRRFFTLWFRTFRYLQMDVITAAEPLTINSLRNTFTGYPFKLNATFTSDDPSLTSIWNVAWRTARLCAGENYFDCPYYEQLQYVGDTRIQALISLYLTGDDRLVRQAINHYDDSRLPEGLTQSRYPSRVAQVIPPFSLFWVLMLHDYWMHRPDAAFVEAHLSGVRGVLEWFENRLGPDGVLGPLPWWNFVDWVDQYPYGVPPGAAEGGSAVVSLQFAYALRCASQMSLAFGRDWEAAHYRDLSERVGRATLAACWSAERGLLANTPEKKMFSQHTNALAILLDIIPPQEQKKVFERITSQPDVVRATFYFQFYVLEAMRHCGLGEDYVARLEPWRDMIRYGLTTFAETPEPTRSDCHAWSASPAWGFLSSVCGIRPSAPGFRTVRIEPALGPLKQAKASMPHPDGTLAVSLERKGARGVSAVIELPGAVQGAFVWDGVEYGLAPGRNLIEAPGKNK